MKITYAGYLPTPLLGRETQKKTNVCSQKGLTGCVDVPVLSEIPEKALVMYLKVIDEIISDIVNINDSNTPLTDNAENDPIQQKVPRQMVITPQDILTLLPGSTSGTQGSIKKGELVITKDNVLAQGIGLSGEPDEDTTAGIVQDIARELSSIDVGLGMKIHERITYYFHLFAGLYTGGPDTISLQGSVNKESVADDRENEKVKFEKRLNELRMLLESSYQLKESFMQMRFSGSNGSDEERH
jgi:hypothetical protein